MPPLGSRNDPYFTRTAPFTAGTAVAIGVAGAALVASQAVSRSWRHVSLGQGRGLLLARLPFLLVLLAATSTVGAVGAFVLFPRDARALGALLPIFGIIAPFAFLARRANDETAGTSLRPTRARITAWTFESPLNFIFILPGVAGAGACAWVMARTRSWDVLAFAFSISVAIITRTEPHLYYAWDGIGARWQWGRLLPSPVRGHSWRFVAGRTEDENGTVQVHVDAMETPLSDSTVMNGTLHEENEAVCDWALASSISRNGVLQTMASFYRYVDTVWVDIIHSTRNGTENEGRELDRCAAGSFLIVFSVLKEALDGGGEIGADVWLWLAILNYRLIGIQEDFVMMREWAQVPILARIKYMIGSIRSAFAGRSVQATSITLDDEVLSEIVKWEGAEQRADRASKVQTSTKENSDIEVEEQEKQVTTDDTDRVENTDEADSNSSNRYRLRIMDALDDIDEPPADSNGEHWALWLITCLENMYFLALEISRDDINIVSNRQAESFGDSLSDYLGEEGWGNLLKRLENMFKAELIENDSSRSFSDGEKMTYAKEATQKVANSEIWTYAMLSMASRVLEKRESSSATDVAFLPADIDVTEGELNGRLKAQNIARKFMIAQASLWTYVAVGQTATALLASGM